MSKLTCEGLKEGWYYWAPDPLPDQQENASYILHLSFSANGLPRTLAMPDAAHTGKWGPRIPDPQVLEAMYELASLKPWQHVILPKTGPNGEDACTTVCPFCWASKKCFLPQDPLPLPDHNPGCLWLRAQVAP